MTLGLGNFSEQVFTVNILEGILYLGTWLNVITRHESYGIFLFDKDQIRNRPICHKSQMVSA